MKWYVGGDVLRSWVPTGSRLANSVIRVGIDTAFSAGDTAYSALADLVTSSSNKTWRQVWNEHGGWNATAISIIIGLAGSTTGEVIDTAKINKQLNSISILKSLEELNPEIAKQIRNELELELRRGNIKKGDDISEKIATLLDKYNETVLKEDPTNVFKTYKTEIGSFGCDQGCLTNLRSKNEKVYERVKELLTKKYNFSEIDADKFMNMVDIIGACNYARSVNSMLDGLQDFTDYKKLFGFDMYILNSEGEVCLNDIELLVDYYYWGNAKSEEAVLICVEEGKSFIRNNEFYSPDGNKVVPQRGGNWEKLNEYLQYKVKEARELRGYDGTIEVVSKKVNFNECTTKKQKIQLLSDLINDGETISIGGTGYTVKSLDGTINMKKISGHWIFITGLSEEGFLVSSWAKECIVPYNSIFDLAPDYYDFIEETYKFTRLMKG